MITAEHKTWKKIIIQIRHSWGEFSENCQIELENTLDTFFKKQQRQVFRQIKTQLNAVLKCEKCNGTGLEGWQKNNEDYKWNNTDEFCDKCHGIGFINIDKKWLKSDELFICNRCNGFGCSKCEYTGIVSWIVHARGG